MKKIIVEGGQTIEDLALIHYGAVEGVIDIMADNDLGVDAVLYAGQKLLIQDTIPELTDNNYAVQQAMVLNGIIPHSSIEGPAPDGLYVAGDYMDDDFVD